VKNLPGTNGSSKKTGAAAFRPDINGLRALAVLSVLFYHFTVPGFGGGYVGVDVFFVISGFLMTRIIDTKLSASRFALTGFYIARVRRIVPALTALTVALLVGGFFFLTPNDYGLLGRQASGAVTFVYNILLSHKANYFDADTREKWFLHTWSLSVEWQFYLLFPFILMGLKKFKDGRFLKQGIIAAFIFSLLLCAVKTRQNQTAAFYLLDTRGWEFLAGGLVYYFDRYLPRKKYLEYGGIVLILLAVFFYADGLEYPGCWALLPVLGAAAVIGARSTGRLLDNRLMQFFGDISYSLYLWHWPVFLGARYFDVILSSLHIIFLLAVSTLLATASYMWIETPFRHVKSSASDKKTLALFLGGIASVAGAAYLIFFMNGLPFRVPKGVQTAEMELQDVNPLQSECFFHENQPVCRLGAKAVPSVVIWGDSHADAVFTTLGESLNEAGRAGLFYAVSGCPPVPGGYVRHSAKDGCNEFNRTVYDKIISDPAIKDVLMISQWPVYLKGYVSKKSFDDYIVFTKGEKADALNLQERTRLYAEKTIETMCSLTAHGKRVYVMETVPEMDRSVPTELAKSRLLYHSDADISVSLSDYAQRNAPVLETFKKAKKQCGIHILDPKLFLCDKKSCQAIKNGIPLYRDDNHLSEYGSRFLKPMFNASLL